MIARALSSGTICLGCRLRLLRQATRPNSLPQPIARRSPAVAWPRSRRWFASEASARPDDADQKQTKNGWDTLEEASEDQYRDYLNEQDALSDLDNGRPDKPRRSRGGKTNENMRERRRQTTGDEEENFKPWKHLDLKKRRLSGKKVLTETSASLGSDMLGKPAYAIVMKDSRDYKAKTRPVDVLNEEQTRQEIDMQALLDNRHELPTDSEVRENINELRPPETETILKEKEFRRVQQQLEDGFLNAQLIDYIAKFKPEPAGRDSVEHARPQYPWVRKLTPWTPLDARGTTLPPKDPLARHFHAYLPQDASPKARAAVLIMRKCWGLQVEEVANGPGQMRIVLETQKFMPLMRGSRRFLQRITRDYLEEGEALEANISASEITIVAPSYKCQTILTELDTLMQQIRTHTFPISHVTSDPTQLTPELLELVGKVTNTHVRPTKTGHRLQVAWIQVAGREEQDVENLSHVVFRFLQTALQPNSAKRILHTADAEKAIASGNGRLVVDHGNKEKWAWKDRLEQWARLVTPVSTDIENTQAGPADGNPPKLSMAIEKLQPLPRNVHVPNKTLTNSVAWKDGERAEDWSSSSPPQQVEVQDSSSSRFPHQPVRWTSDLTSSTSALFGHILTPRTDVAKAEGAPPAHPSTEDLASRPYNFSPIVPHPIRLAELSLLDENTMLPVASTVLIRFLHNPSSAALALPLVAPPLELRLTLSEPTSADQDPEITGVHSLRALVATHHNEVPLPASPVDFRITQTRGASLQGSPSALSAWQPIADFLSRSRLDIAAGKLEMAAQQRFQVPLRLFGEATMTQEAMRKKKQQQQQQQQQEQQLAAVDDESQTRGDSTSTSPAQEEGDIIAQPISAAGGEDHPNSLRSTLYEFAGLELHRSVTVPYSADPRFSLTYTSIEAGQGGGRRAELSLRPVPASSSSVPPPAAAASEAAASGSDNLHDDYVRACYKFAQTVENWSGISSGDNGS
ncbi:mitochondrial inner-membrane-bound regulator-domain-containing protein [Truncatella angustata]|uniref:Mitochondrial inner-membrane-bound regulator-domain-containing protein n=1 Tax=Truncatella angustata TaxID=152316 RepID=A0A9P8UGJ7_9PEZI|nr:mitochondrial inner-membrane-bound regulator-domain-containing protein [Truncatella angustata]KAH6651819.1 mitochondrial inner-membrane-bound regulator-domain-containing protein [Truncatella angustata]KAH8196007.1 hypothetical protein TruAng_009814 [Truncatella angustata]